VSKYGKLFKPIEKLLVEAGEEAGEKVAKEAAEETAEKAAKEVAEEAAEETAEKAAKEAAEEAAEEGAEEAAEEGAEEAAEEAAKDAADQRAKDELKDLYDGGNRTPTREELQDYGRNQGWESRQTEGSPEKYYDVDDNKRLTIKDGSARTPGSEGPHIEAQDRHGQRWDPYDGSDVSKRSPGNHRPFDPGS
jgi:hypothetical protein